MIPNKTALERAFELASSGKCLHVADIRHHLKEEGYNSDQIQGTQLNKQLEKIIRRSVEQAD